jgi:DNA polymerase V
MGAPHFQWRSFFKEHGVVAFSANFELYGDMSERITNLLASITPRLEVYSVDESFLDLSELSIKDYRAWGYLVRRSLLQQVGLPVSIGIAPSKTLAKLASERAKKIPQLGGILQLGEQGAATDRHLGLTDVQEVWGVGRRLAPKLHAEGVRTAFDLKQLSSQRAKQLMGVTGQRTRDELNGVSCLPLAATHKPQQMITRGRQFGEDTREFYVIESAIASLTARATSQLRAGHQLAKQASVMLRTNRHRPGYQTHVETVRFYTPTADTGIITSQLVRLLASGLPPSTDFHRSDVLLHDLVPDTSLQTDLLGTVNLAENTNSQRKMQALDAISRQHGKHTIGFAAETLSRKWRPRKQLASPRYTSAWEDLPIVKLV